MPGELMELGGRGNNSRTVLLSFNLTPPEGSGKDVIVVWMSHRRPGRAFVRATRDTRFRPYTIVVVVGDVSVGYATGLLWFRTQI